MKNKLLFFIFCALFLQALNVQAKPAKKFLMNPYQYSSDAVTGNPFSAIIGLEKQRKEYLDSEHRKNYFNVLSTLYSYVGEYDKAISTFDEITSASNHTAAASFQNVTPVNAVQSILAMAPEHQVIMLNEAHHMPAHRAFTRQLLQGLYDKGFRYFAAEALSSYDKKLNQRGHAEIGITGLYTNDPVFAHLLRDAIKIGFELVTYKDQQLCKRRDNDLSFCQNKREKNQAKNIYDKTLKIHPEAKVLVHTGGNMTEKGAPRSTAMGAHFHQLTGINALTIDQQSLGPRSTPAHENKYYRRALQQFKFEQPVVLKNKTNAFWVQPHLKGSYNVQVFHPHTRYKMQRPAWRFFTNHKPTLLKKPCPEYPCLLLARSTQESERAVPFDQVILRSAKDIKPLLLPAGKYTIQAVGSTDNLLTEKLLTVK